MSVKAGDWLRLSPVARFQNLRLLKEKQDKERTACKKNKQPNRKISISKGYHK